MNWVAILIIVVACLVITTVYAHNRKFSIKEKSSLALAKIVHGDVIETIPCHLLVAEEYSETTNYVFDFSRYEDYEIIGMILQHPKGTPRDEDGNLNRVGFCPNTKIRKFEDGTLLWV